ncbi:hypothetical protein OIU85_005749 [Salix viminalis]|uniref:Imidazoleglycerol-phosphate dehydratase n=1 Tax=Salix viminalis TaxID=40686 RepID=A0A9Q0PJM8_SALVM|nr:hypothetical protein OIU85_005749 [Salix viminalis]
MVPTRIPSHTPPLLISSTPLLMDSHTTTTTTTSKPFQANCSSSSPIGSRTNLTISLLSTLFSPVSFHNILPKLVFYFQFGCCSAACTGHGLFDVHVRATGDIHIDDHHTNEDVALAIGTALLQALGDRKGINRFCDYPAPLDEALIHVSLDLPGRPYLGYDLQIPTQRVGTYDTQLAGRNSHHIIEATFKAFGQGSSTSNRI